MIIFDFLELKKDNRGVWHMAFSILIDHEEASVVRENCAFLLANLAGHTCQNYSGDLTIVTSLVPDTMKMVSF